MSLREVFDRFLPQIETELQDIVRPSHQGLTSYYGMMRYHLGWVDEKMRPIQANSGKRLRPLLCLLSCEAAGGEPQKALPAAAAIELIHNFSLVHDDIQDASEFRRGRPAVWSIWGPAHGINVGDGLFVLARLAMQRLERLGVSAASQQAAIAALDRACLSLCEGQYADLTFQDRMDVDLDQYLTMIRHKTAALLAASTQVGATIAAHDRALIDHYGSFGENLGIAFQIQDDILGIWGDARVTGKSAGTDIRDKKKALPAVYALNQLNDRNAARRLAELYAQEGPLDGASIEAVLAILDRVGARKHAEEMAAQYHHRALQSLRQTGIENTAQSHLRELAASLLGRQA
jgi:geranylgeranyl diphosphate synthase type I